MNTIVKVLICEVIYCTYYIMLMHSYISHSVLVLDNGEIKEFDTPATLLNDHNTIFYGMAKDAGLV